MGITVRAYKLYKQHLTTHVPLQRVSLAGFVGVARAQYTWFLFTAV